ATAGRIRTRPGDTWDKAYTRKQPFLGNLFVTPTMNMIRRWRPAVIKGDFSTVVNGDPEKGLMGYREHPVLTLLEDMTPFTVLGGAASVGRRIPAVAATSAARAAARVAMVARAESSQVGRLAARGLTKIRIHGKEFDLSDAGGLRSYR